MIDKSEDRDALVLQNLTEPFHGFINRMGCRDRDKSAVLSGNLPSCTVSFVFAVPVSLCVAKHTLRRCRCRFSKVEERTEP